MFFLSFSHVIVFPSWIYGFWLPLWFPNFQVSVLCFLDNCFSFHLFSVGFVLSSIFDLRLLPNYKCSTSLTHTVQVYRIRLDYGKNIPLTVNSDKQWMHSQLSISHADTNTKLSTSMLLTSTQHLHHLVNDALLFNHLRVGEESFIIYGVATVWWRGKRWWYWVL